MNYLLVFSMPKVGKRMYVKKIMQYIKCERL